MPSEDMLKFTDFRLFLGFFSDNDYKRTPNLLSDQEIGIAKLSGFREWFSNHLIIRESEDATSLDMGFRSQKTIIFAHHLKVLDGIQVNPLAWFIYLPFLYDTEVRLWGPMAFHYIVLKQDFLVLVMSLTSCCTHLVNYLNLLILWMVATGKILRGTYFKFMSLIYIARFLWSLWQCMGMQIKFLFHDDYGFSFCYLKSIKGNVDFQFGIWNHLKE